MEIEPSKYYNSIIPRRTSDLQVFFCVSELSLFWCWQNFIVLRHKLFVWQAFEKYKTTLTAVYIIEIELSRYWNCNAPCRFFFMSVFVWHRILSSFTTLKRILFVRQPFLYQSTVWKSLGNCLDKKTSTPLIFEYFLFSGIYQVPHQNGLNFYDAYCIKKHYLKQDSHCFFARASYLCFLLLINIDYNLCITPGWKNNYVHKTNCLETYHAIDI